MSEVVLIYDSDCPNVTGARANLLDAFGRAALPPRWTEWDRNDPRAPASVRSFGSPTILVNGRDIAGGDAHSDSCRLYEEDGQLRGVPPVATICRALENAVGIGASPKSLLLAMPGIVAALLPKLACPACWPAYSALLGSLGLGFLIQSRYLMPVTIALLALTLAAIGWRARTRNGYGPLIASAAASASIIGGKFTFDSDPLFYAGAGALICAAIWNVWPHKAVPAAGIVPPGRRNPHERGAGKECCQ